MSTSISIHTGSSTILNNSTGYGLSVPKLRLDAINGDVNITTFDRSTNSIDGTFMCKKPPYIIAQDLTLEQIQKGVYVEMVVFKKGNRGRRSKNKNDGFKVPSTFGPNITNPFNGSNTRFGAHVVGNKNNGSLQTMAEDRFNHYRVTTPMEKIPVWEYLNTFMCRQDIIYTDANGSTRTENCITTINGVIKHKAIPGTKYAYSAQYQNMRFAFRYVMQTDDKKSFITGGLTPTVVLQHEFFPFIIDINAINNFGQARCSINPSFKNEELICNFDW
jgi:hypothetical protein